MLEVKEGQLSVTPQSPGTTVRWAQSIRVPGTGWHLEPDEEGYRNTFPWVESDGAFQTNLWLENLTRATNLVKKVYPELHSELLQGVSAIVPTSKGPAASQRSGTDMGAWKAIAVSLVSPPYLACSLVHEYRHNLLNTLQLLDEVVVRDSYRIASGYSPWRDDPRPTVGILHATFVFVSVTELLSRLADAKSELDEDTRGTLRIEVGANALRLKIALAELTDAPELSPFGRQLLEALRLGAEQLHRKAVDQGALTEKNGLARKRVLAHYDRWGTSRSRLKCPFAEVMG